MTCAKCGARCQGHFCRDCEREQRYGDGTTGGTDETKQTDQLIYECTSEGCGATYKATSIGECPHCGGHRGRCIGKAKEGIA